MYWQRKCFLIFVYFIFASNISLELESIVKQNVLRIASKLATNAGRRIHNGHRHNKNVQRIEMREEIEKIIEKVYDNSMNFISYIKNVDVLNGSKRRTVRDFQNNFFSKLETMADTEDNVFLEIVEMADNVLRTLVKRNVDKNKREFSLKTIQVLKRNTLDDLCKNGSYCLREKYIFNDYLREFSGRLKKLDADRRITALLSFGMAALRYNTNGFLKPLQEDCIKYMAIIGTFGAFDTVNRRLYDFEEALSHGTSVDSVNDLLTFLNEHIQFDKDTKPLWDRYPNAFSEWIDGKRKDLKQIAVRALENFNNNTILKWKGDVLKNFTSIVEESVKAISVKIFSAVR